MEPSFDTWTSTFVVVALHGIILAGLFFFRTEGRKLPNKLLGLLLLVFSLNLFGNILYWTHYNLVFPHLTGIGGTFYLLYGPLLFFYVRSIVNPGRNWQAIDVIHFVPLLLLIVWMSSFFLLSASEKVALLKKFATPPPQELPLQALIVASVKAISMAGYTLSIMYLFLHKKKWNGKKLINISDQTYNWMQIISYNFSGFVIMFITYFVLVSTINFRIEYDYMISFAMSAFIFGIGYLGLIKPSYLREAHNGKHKYESSSLSDSEADRYVEKLLSHMNEEQPYLDGDLKIVDLAEKLAIPSHHLSQIINSKLEQNFFEFINSYRIKNAKSLLADPDKSDFKILRVAFESGFNNKTTFNSAFKENVGTTPSQFRKRKLNGHLKKN